MGGEGRQWELGQLHKQKIETSAAGSSHAIWNAGSSRAQGAVQGWEGGKEEYRVAVRLTDAYKTVSFCKTRLAPTQPLRGLAMGKCQTPC